MVNKRVLNIQRGDSNMSRKLIVLITMMISFNTYAVTDEQRNYCLQHSYDAQQIAENKLRGVRKESLLHFLASLPRDRVPEGYIESNMLTVMDVYDMQFKTAEEVQQRILIKCLNWHEEFGEIAVDPSDFI